MKKFPTLLFGMLLCTFSLTVGMTGVAQNPAASKSEAVKPAPWAIQVERVDSTVVALPPEFSTAIYEDLIDQISKANRFDHVFRSGDHRAEGSANLLTLKTSVEKFQQGSETTRAVTTVGGFTKIFVRMQLVKKDGSQLLDKTVEGKIRFFGENLKATHDLTKGMAKLLAQTPIAN
jgi:hypothetical protein